MKLELLRYNSGDDATCGSLFERADNLSRKWLCYTLEDEARDVKVRHETCIPVGKYRIELRTEGNMNSKYMMRYKFHRGMLWLREKFDGVNWSEDWGFTYVYIHTGNTDDHTSGCPLVGLTQSDKYTLQRSRLAYEKIYPLIAERIISGEEVELDVSMYA